MAVGSDDELFSDPTKSGRDELPQPMATTDRPAFMKNVATPGFAKMVFVALPLLLGACSSEAETTADGEGDELTGGFLDSNNALSSVVALTDNTNCTATRVSGDTLLLAAHCVLAAPNVLRHSPPIPKYNNRTLGFLPGDIQMWVPNPQGRASDALPWQNALEVVQTTVHPAGLNCASNVSGARWFVSGEVDLALVRVRQIPLKTVSRIAIGSVPSGTPVAVVGAGWEGASADTGYPRRKFAYTKTASAPNLSANFLFTPGRPNGGFASLAPGDSGGPLLNARGNIVGVNSMALVNPGDVYATDALWGSHVAVASPSALAWLMSQLPASSFGN